MLQIFHLLLSNVICLVSLEHDRAGCAGLLVAAAKILAFLIRIIASVALGAHVNNPSEAVMVWCADSNACTV